MSTLAERFTAAVELAMAMDTPAQILRRILADPADNGLRAAALDGKIRGGDKLSHPERMSTDERRRPDTQRHQDDAITLARTAEVVAECVVGLLDVCLHKSPDISEYSWGEALKDGHLLAEMGLVDAALSVDVDRTTTRTVERFCEAVQDLAHLAKRWPKRTGRAPSDIEASWTSGLADEDCCRICLTVEPLGALRVERHRGDLCRVCYELRQASGGIEPPEWLIAVWHDCDRKGQSVQWRNARERWLESVGVRAS